MAEPISLEEAKRILKIDINDVDEDIKRLIKQAREYCEEYQNRRYMTQTLELVFDEFPNEIEFKNCSPVQSIVSIKYIDAAGVEKTIANTDYILDNVSFVNRIVPAYGKQWPSERLLPINAVSVQFVAGYANAADVPESIKGAMALHMQSMYDNCQPSERTKLENTRDALLGSKRVIPV